MAFASQTSVTASLYLHIPFCKKICTYCDFPRELFDGERAAVVTRHILRRMRELPAEFTHPELATVFWGGGTPSCLPVSMLSQLAGEIPRVWRLAADCEHTMEVNPEDVNSELATFLLRQGINRISMGAQSFSCLQVLGRRHTAEQTRRAVALLREAGLKNLNLDIMFALPEQDLPGLEQDLDEILRLSPEHISCYGLTIEPGTPLATEVGEGRLFVPDETLWIRMYETVIRTLTEAGYTHYEVSNFARPGFACRHNLRIWEGADYLGLGPGAASRWKQWRFTDFLDVAPSPPAAPHLPFAVETEEVDARGQDIETLLTGLRLLEGLELKKLRCPVPDDRICDLRKEGLLWQTQGRVGLTRSGLLVADTVLSRMVDALGCSH